MKYNVLLPSRNLQLTALLKGGGKEGKEEKSRGFEKMLRKGSLPSSLEAPILKKARHHLSFKWPKQASQRACMNISVNACNVRRALHLGD